MSDLTTAPIVTGEHELSVTNDTREAASECGRYVEQHLTGWSRYRCSCGAKGAGQTPAVMAEVREHAGI